MAPEGDFSLPHPRRRRASLGSLSTTTAHRPLKMLSLIRTQLASVLSASPTLAPRCSQLVIVSAHGTPFGPSSSSSTRWPLEALLQPTDPPSMVHLCCMQLKAGALGTRRDAGIKCSSSVTSTRQVLRCARPPHIAPRRCHTSTRTLSSS